jgi:hypothetical protein
LKKIKREKSTSTKGHYVTNAVLLPAFMEAKEKGVVTDKLIKMIEMIAERYSRKANFVNYSFREDMVASAVLNQCNNALKFDPTRSDTPNPFSYYTTGIHNSFLQYIQDEKRHRQIRDQLLIDAGSNPSFNYQEKSISDSDTMTGPSTDMSEDPLEEKAAKLKEGEVAPKKIVLFRNEHKEPSKGEVFKPSQMVYDETLGYFVKKPVEEKPKKKAAAKKTSKKEA